MPQEPGLADVIAGQRELLARLRAVVEAKDAEIAVLRAGAGCGAGAEAAAGAAAGGAGAPAGDGQLRLGDAELEGADRGEGGAAGAAAVRAGAPEGPQAGRAARSPG